MMRAWRYRPVHVKTLQPEIGMLLPHRKLLQSKVIAIENDLRATLCNFRSRGVVGTAVVEARIKEVVANLPGLGRAGRTASHCPAVLREKQIDIPHRRLQPSTGR
jgi:hypothetical protein